MKTYQLYSSCVISHGFTRSIIVDLFRGKYYYTSPNICRVFLETDMNIDFLLKNDLVYELYYPFLYNENILPVSSSYTSVSNIVLYINNDISTLILDKIHMIIDRESTSTLLIVFCERLSEDLAFKTLSYFYYSNLRSIEVVIDYNVDADFSRKLYSFNPRITTIIYYSAPYNKCSKIGDFYQTFIIYTITALNGLFKKLIEENDFICNIKFYNDSFSHNPFYCRKLIIDNNGDIYNDYERSKIIGNISIDSYIEINNSKALEYRKIPKSKIDICADCEFKYVCPDNRIPIKRENGTWYHNSECAYNPYIGKWLGDNGYYSLLDSGIQCNRDSFNIDYKMLMSIMSKIKITL